MKKTFCFIFACLLLFGAFPLCAFAAGFENPMENTAVIDDLNAMHFDLNAYPKDPSADFVSVVQFMEYGYSAKKDFRYYGLYVYLYNPSGVAIDTSKVKLQMAYEPRGSANGEYGSFAKYSLEFISVSGEGEYENLFYKFRVSGSRSIASEVKDGRRAYYLSGIEFAHSGTDDYKDYLLDESWIYIGYQLNFGVNEGDPSSLYVTKDVIEVITTELHEATWKSNTSDLGEDYRYELSSVYFYIPDYFINEYGDPSAEASGLYSVRGMYDKFATNGLVVPDQASYDAYHNIAVKHLSNYSDTSGGYVSSWSSFSKLRKTSPSYGVGIPLGAKDHYYSFSFNYAHPATLGGKCYSDRQLDIFYNVGMSSTGSLSSADFKTILKENLYKNRRVLPSELVTEFQGLGADQTYEIFVDGKPLNDQIKSFASSQRANWLHKLFNRSLYVDEDGYPEIKPIVELSETEIPFVNDKYISEKYFVAQEYVEELRSFVSDYRFGNHLYLMRFDVNPYYAPEVFLDYYPVGSDSLVYDTGFYFEKVFYENFDILEFTFRDQSGGLATIPVNCTPIDIVGTIVPGNNQIEGNPNNPTTDELEETPSPGLKDLKPIFAVLVLFAGIVCLILIFKLFGVSVSMLFKGIGWLISAPFKLIGKGVNFVEDRLDKKSDRDSRKEERSRKREDQEFRRQDQRMKEESHGWKREDHHMKEESHEWKREDHERKSHKKEKK